MSKIFILGHHDVYRTLATFIEPANIPKKYGGALDFDFGQAPTLDPAYADRLRWTHPLAKGEKERRWPQGPMAWRTRDDGAWDLLAVGSERGQPRREVLATLLPDTAADGGGADGLAAGAAKLSIMDDAAQSSAPAVVDGAAAHTAQDEPETVRIPVEPKVDPVPLAAVATELPPEKSEVVAQPADLANGKAT